MSPVDPPVPADQMVTVLSSIAVQARRTNQSRAADIRQALRLSTGGTVDANGWAAAERTAHQLAGSAGTFGYATASDLARELEALLAGMAADDGMPEADRLAAALALIDRLSEQLAADPDPDHADPDLD